MRGRGKTGRRNLLIDASAESQKLWNNELGRGETRVHRRCQADLKSDLKVTDLKNLQSRICHVHHHLCSQSRIPHLTLSYAAPWASVNPGWERAQSVGHLEIISVLTRLRAVIQIQPDTKYSSMISSLTQQMPTWRWYGVCELLNHKVDVVLKPYWHRGHVPWLTWDS